MGRNKVVRAATYRWASKKQVRACISTLAAEALSAEAALDVNFATRRRIQEALNMPEPPPGVLLTDSWSFVTNIYSATPHLSEEDLTPAFQRVREAVVSWIPKHCDKVLPLELLWMPDSEMVADPLTKDKSNPEKLLAPIRSGTLTFTSASKPATAPPASANAATSARPSRQGFPAEGTAVACAMVATAIGARVPAAPGCTSKARPPHPGATSKAPAPAPPAGRTAEEQLAALPPARRLSNVERQLQHNALSMMCTERQAMQKLQNKQDISRERQLERAVDLAHRELQATQKAICMDKRIKAADNDAPDKPEKYHDALYRRDVSQMGHHMSARKLRDRQKAKRDRADWEQRRGRHSGREENAVADPDYVSDSAWFPRKEPCPVVQRERSRSRDRSPVSSESDGTLSCDGDDKATNDRNHVFAKADRAPELKLSTDRKMTRPPPTAARKAKKAAKRAEKKRAKKTTTATTDC